MKVVPVATSLISASSCLKDTGLKVVWGSGDRRSDRVAVPLAGANADHLVHRGDEDLPVPDPSGSRGAGYRLNDLRRMGVVDQHHDLHLGHELDHVFGAPIELRVPFLSPESLHLFDRHAVDSDSRQDFLHLVELEWLDHRLDLLHRAPLGIGCAAKSNLDATQLKMESASNERWSNDGGRWRT